MYILAVCAPFLQNFEQLCWETGPKLAIHGGHAEPSQPPCRTTRHCRKTLATLQHTPRHLGLIFMLGLFHPINCLLHPVNCWACCISSCLLHLLSCLLACYKIYKLLARPDASLKLLGLLHILSCLPHLLSCLLLSCLLGLLHHLNCWVCYIS